MSSSGVRAGGTEILGPRSGLVAGQDRGLQGGVGLQLVDVERSCRFDSDGGNDLL